MSSIPPEDQLSELAEKWRNGTITEEEKITFNTWYNSFDDTELVIEEQGTLDSLGADLNARIKTRLSFRSSPRKNVKWWYLAAAVLLMSGTGIYFSSGSISSALPKENNQLAGSVQPGGNKAFLTLSNGKKISLTDTTNGQIAEQSGISITKTASGQLVYTVKNSATLKNAGKTEFNTIETPPGGQYQIDLPDGTKVWLNAASSLKFPTHFAGTQRRVELTGEGYFEVSKDKKKPFTVVTAQQQVQVLGTHFNINAYKDENATRTTLLEGSVKVLTGTQNQAPKLLSPGQQSTVAKNTFKVDHVDTDNVIAWKNGYFTFNGEDLEVSMRKLSRWYNVEVVYEGNFDNISFGGSISRSRSLTEVLKILELTRKMKFKIEGRRVIVMS